MAVVLGIVRTGWTGTSGGPGLTQLAVEAAADPHTWNSAAAQSAVDAVRVFWDGVKALMPDDIVLTVSPVVDIYSIATGELVGSHSATTPPTSVTGTNAGAFAMASGMKMNLNTGVIRDGRRVRGSVFLVPASGAATGSNGLVLSASRTTVNTAGNAMRGALTTAGLNLVVWSRPTSPGPSTDGATAICNGVETSEKGAVLRGRRD